jgi:hypothetical protein
MVFWKFQTQRNSVYGFFRNPECTSGFHGLTSQQFYKKVILTRPWMFWEPWLYIWSDFKNFLLKCNCISESILRFLRTMAICQNWFSDFIQQGLCAFKNCSQNLSSVPFLVTAQTGQNSKQEQQRNRNIKNTWLQKPLHRMCFYAGIWSADFASVNVRY